MNAFSEWIKACRAWLQDELKRRGGGFRVTKKIAADTLAAQLNESFGAKKPKCYPVNSTNIESWINGARPDIPIPIFVLALGLASAEDENGKSLYAQAFELDDQPYQDPSSFKAAMASRRAELSSFVSHLPPEHKLRTLALFRGSSKGLFLSDFVAGVSNACARSGLVFQCESPKLPGKEKECEESLNKLLDLNPDVLLLAHWPASANIAVEMIKKREQRPQVIRFESQFVWLSNTIEVSQNHAGIVKCLRQQVINHFDPLRSEVADLRVGVVNDYSKKPQETLDIQNEGNSFSPLSLRGHAWAGENHPGCGIATIEIHCDAGAGLGIDSKNSDAIRRAIEKGELDAIVCMWNEFARLTLDVLRHRNAHPLPVFTVDFSLQDFQEMKNPNSNLQGAVYVDPFMAGIRCVEAYLQSMKDVELEPCSVLKKDILKTKNTYTEFLLR